MAKSCPIPSYFIVVFVISRLMSIIGELRPWTSLLPPELISLDLATRLHVDPDATIRASTDFGKLVQEIPAAVLSPSSHDDIATLIRFSYTSSAPFSIAARGRGHSIHGQAMALNGIVVDMTSLNDYTNRRRRRISISRRMSDLYVDVGGEQLWIDVLLATLEHGLTPRSWTDYLYLTVGGTLSNAGISGQAFRHGPQISNVHEMDVITGRGEMVTCSKQINSELFFAVLGGLGQFGIITRARIALEPAPQMVRWVRMFYHDFSVFTRDQEHLISMNGLDYVEGSLMMDGQTPANISRSSFFSPIDLSRLTSLVTKHGIIYYIEVAKYYNNGTIDTIDQELEFLLKDLSYIPGFRFVKDVVYIDFLNRVRKGELKLQSQGLWDIPHPWLNLLVPKSRISDFDSGVFKGILRQTNTTGPILVYPMNRNKWDERMSAITPDEDIFYSIGLLRSSGQHDWKYLEDQNKEILQFCDKAGIKLKQYLPHYKSKSEWMNHFGPKWDLFRERKTYFDPKAILSPGQRIFSSMRFHILKSV